MARSGKSARACAVAAAGIAALAVGCGREQPPDLVNGKQLFVGKGTCGSCHALARAATKGTRGPSLDEAFVQARRDGLGEDTIEGVVRDQIANARRGSLMARDLVKGEDARDVAAYVAMAAAAGGKDTGALAQAGQPKRSGKPALAKNGKLEIPADPTGALAFVVDKAQAEAGAVEFVSPNESPVSHNIAVKGAGAAGKGPVVAKGGTSEFSASLKPGKYTFYCSVPGHEQGGMKGTLEVK